MTIDELNALTTLTATDEVPVWDSEESGEPTKKITAQNFASSVKTLGGLLGGEDVVNDLTSTDTNKPGSAAMLKTLNDKMMFYGTPNTAGSGIQYVNGNTIRRIQFDSDSIRIRQTTDGGTTWSSSLLPEITSNVSSELINVHSNVGSVGAFLHGKIFSVWGNLKPGTTDQTLLFNLPEKYRPVTGYVSLSIFPWHGEDLNKGMYGGILGLEAQFRCSSAPTGTYGIIFYGSWIIN